MPKNVGDVVRLWFTAGEELGEYIGIRFGRIALGASEPEWFFLRHTDYDGIGGFAELLRRRGCRVERLPQIKYPISPSRFSLLRFLPKYLKPRRRVRWAPMERGVPQTDGTQPPPAVAWHLFDEGATLQIRRVCRQAAVTVNSFLLRQLTKAIRPFLEDQSSVVPWMIPVNLRGKIHLERDTANHTSYVTIKVQSYETVHEIHKHVYFALSRGEHWANWQAYQLGRYMTQGMRRYAVAKELAMSQWNLGGFSNLGDWDPGKEISETEALGGWIFCPPVLRCQVLGAGCVTFQNRLSLAIQAHPDLTTDPSVPKRWVQNWVKEIEIDLVNPPRSPISAVESL